LAVRVREGLTDGLLEGIFRKSKASLLDGGFWARETDSEEPRGDVVDQFRSRRSSILLRLRFLVVLTSPKSHDEMRSSGRVSELVLVADLDGCGRIINGHLWYVLYDCMGPMCVCKGKAKNPGSQIEPTSYDDFDGLSKKITLSVNTVRNTALTSQ